MADKKIAQLTELAIADLAATDWLVVGDTSASDNAKKMSPAFILQAIGDYSVTNYTTAGPHSLAAAANGTIHTNVGSAVGMEFDLPAATVGLILQFARVENYYVRLDPNGSETIGSGAAGKYLELQTAGFVKLRCFKAGVWTIVNDSAAWDWEV